MKALCTSDEASFHGTYVDFAESWQWHKPVHPPRLPVWIGGSRATLPHVVECGTGWMPIEGVMPVAKLARSRRDMATDAGPTRSR